MNSVVLGAEFLLGGGALEDVADDGGVEDGPEGGLEDGPEGGEGGEGIDCFFCFLPTPLPVISA